MHVVRVGWGVCTLFQEVQLVVMVSLFLQTFQIEPDHLRTCSHVSASRMDRLKLIAPFVVNLSR